MSACFRQQQTTNKGTRATAAVQEQAVIILYKYMAIDYAGMGEQAARASVPHFFFVSTCSTITLMV